MWKRKPTRAQLSEMISDERTALREAARTVQDDHKTRFLMNGRRDGLDLAQELLWEVAQWTPTTRRGVLNRIVDRVQEVADTREQVYQENRDNPVVAEALWAREHGRIDALMAVSKAMYGDKERLRTLHLVGDQPRSRRRDRGQELGD